MPGTIASCPLYTWPCQVMVAHAFGRQRPVDLCEFEVSLVYRESSRTAKTVTQRNPASKNQKEKKERKKEKEKRLER